MVKERGNVNKKPAEETLKERGRMTRLTTKREGQAGGGVIRRSMGEAMATRKRKIKRAWRDRKISKARLEEERCRIGISGNSRGLSSGEKDIWRERLFQGENLP